MTSTSSSSLSPPFLISHATVAHSESDLPTLIVFSLEERIFTSIFAAAAARSLRLAGSATITTRRPWDQSLFVSHHTLRGRFGSSSNHASGTFWRKV